MILYKGRMFESDEYVELAKEIESCFDVGTLVFESEDSLVCHLECEGEVVSKTYDCKTQEQKEEIENFAKEHFVGVTWK